MSRHSDAAVEEAALRFQRLADGLDPASAVVERTDDLQAVAQRSHAVRTDEALLRESVDAARAAGRSWNQIAVALGVSRQAARQRFGEKARS